MSYKISRDHMIPVRRWIQHCDGKIITPSGHLPGLKQWVICRSACLFRIFLLKNIADKDQKKALKLKIIQWSPFRETGSYVVYSDKHAMVWIWDESARDAASKEAGVKNPTVIPESVLLPKAGDEGFQYLTCREGVVARKWQRGIITASRWWHKKPGHEEFCRFLVSVDLPPELAEQQPQPVVLLKYPWGKNFLKTDHHTRQKEKTLYFILSSFLLMSMGWQGIKWYQWQQYTKDLTADIRAIEEAITPIATSRARALTDLAVGRYIFSIVSGPRQTELFYEIIRLFPRTENHLIIKWKYQPYQLELTFSGKQFNPEYYVREFEKSKMFSDVSAQRTPDDNSLVVKAAINISLL